MEGRYSPGTESKQIKTGGQIHSVGDVVISAGASNTAAIDLTGTHVNASTVTLSTPQGGINLSAAETTESRNKWGTEIKTGIGFDRTTQIVDGQPSSDSIKDAHSISPGISVIVDRLAANTANNVQINAQHVTIDSTKDLVLQGANIEAGRVKGRVKGGLTIESQKDHRDELAINVALGICISNKPKEDSSERLPAQKETSVDLTELSTKETSNNVATDTVAATHKENTDTKGNKITQIGSTIYDFITKSPINGVEASLSANGKETRTDGVISPSSITGHDGIALDVAGRIHLVGATVSSTNKQVGLSQNRVSSEAIPGTYYSGSGGITIKSTLKDFILRAVQDGIEGNTPLLHPIQREEKDLTVQGGISQRG